MATTNRYRYMDERQLTIGYNSYPPGSPTVGYANVGEDKHCWDRVGNRQGFNNLSIVTDNHQVGLLEGTRYDSGGNPIQILDRYPLTGGQRAVPEPRDYYPAPTLLDKNNWAWKALARTNPNVPVVNMPQQIGELKDLPLLVKRWGGNLLQNLARTHLIGQWAVKPMVSDAVRLVTFAEEAAKRLRWFSRVIQGETLRRRATLEGTEHVDGSWGSEYYLHTATCLVRAKEREGHGRVKTWATVQYKLDPALSLPEPLLRYLTKVNGKYIPHGGSLGSLFKNELYLFLNKSQLGWTSNSVLATAWELLPWSWLIDWFVGFGDTIAATYNAIPLTWSDICVMRTTAAWREYQITSTPAWVSLVGKPHYESRWRKERYSECVPLLPFSCSVPIMSAHKWSILGSLLALKVTR